MGPSCAGAAIWPWIVAGLTCLAGALVMCLRPNRFSDAGSTALLVVAAAGFGVTCQEVIDSVLNRGVDVIGADCAFNT